VGVDIFLPSNFSALRLGSGNCVSGAGTAIVFLTGGGREGIANKEIGGAAISGLLRGGGAVGGGGGGFVLLGISVMFIGGGRSVRDKEKRESIGGGGKLKPFSCPSGKEERGAGRQRSIEESPIAEKAPETR